MIPLRKKQEIQVGLLLENGEKRRRERLCRGSGKPRSSETLVANTARTMVTSRQAIVAALR